MANRLGLLETYSTAGELSYFANDGSEIVAEEAALEKAHREGLPGKVELRDDAGVGVVELGRRETGFAADAFEVEAKERGNEGRVGDSAKGGEVAAGDEGGERADAFLIGHGEEEGAIGAQKAGEFAEEEAGIFEMGDDFHADDGVEGLVGELKGFVEIGLDPADCFRECAGAGEEIGAGDGAGVGEVEEFLDEETFAGAEFEEVAAQVEGTAEVEGEVVEGDVAEASGVFGRVDAVFAEGGHRGRLRQ